MPAASLLMCCSTAAAGAPNPGVYWMPCHTINPEAATGHQHAMHFGDCGRSIRKKLKSQLTVRDIVRRVREWHIHRARLAPGDRCIGGRIRSCERCSKGQHAGIEVKTDNFAGAPHSLCSKPRHHTRTAGDVQNVVHQVAGKRVQQPRAPKGAKTAGTKACS